MGLANRAEGRRQKVQIGIYSVWTTTVAVSMYEYEHVAEIFKRLEQRRRKPRFVGYEHEDEIRHEYSYDVQQQY